VDGPGRLVVPRGFALPPTLQVTEPIHEPPAAQVDLERGRVVGGGSPGMSVAPPVELPQLVQLIKQLFDHDCVATLLLLACQRSCPIRGTPGPLTARPASDPALGTLRSHCLSRQGITFRSRRLQIALVQALHFEASTAFASLQNGHVLTSAGAGSLMNIREIHQTTKAITMKAMIALMNAP
jgi:hypothetical protein